VVGSKAVGRILVTSDAHPSLISSDGDALPEQLRTLPQAFAQDAIVDEICDLIASI
jgi:hypothetical protein